MAMATDFLSEKIGKAQPRAPMSAKPSKILDLQPSHGLATGLKRIGGRSGMSRLGKMGRRGKPLIMHKY